MSDSFKIVSSFGEYQVDIEAGLLAQTLKDVGDIVVFCDIRFLPLVERAGLRVIAIPAEESYKSLDALTPLIEKLKKLGANRKTRLLAIGGGIIQDVAAFCASIYMRGLDWTYVPTTLLGMADSCIGGKSSINVGEYKNIVGTFLPPKRVIIDPHLTQTLAPEQKIAGLCEAAKICFCRGNKTFQDYMAAKPSSLSNEAQLTTLIIASLKAKKWFIEIDEFDQKERLHLNFGHTFGHAIEGASHFRIGHGIAVGIGMLCALQLGRELGLSYKTAETAHVVLLEEHILGLLRKWMSASNDLASIIDIDAVLDRFAADKKHSKDQYHVVWVEETGDVAIKKLPKSNETRGFLSNAITKTMKALAV